MAPVPLMVVAAAAIVIGPIVVVTVTLLAPFAVRLASCVTLLAPVRLRLPPVEATAPPTVKLPALAEKFPDTVDAFSVSALASVSVTLFPLVMPTVLKLLAALVNVMSFTPAASVVVPATFSAPL